VNEQELEVHLVAMYNRLAQRLEELGIEDQMPSKGVFRLAFHAINGHMREVVDKMEEDEEGRDVSHMDIVFRANEELPPNALEIVLVDDGKEHDILGVVDLGDDACYISAHKIIVDKSGKVESFHENGSPCKVTCRYCFNPEVYVRGEEGENVAWCRSCGAYTEGYADKHAAIAAWIIGKVTEDVR
jgi:hypothetical protein